VLTECIGCSRCFLCLVESDSDSGGSPAGGYVTAAADFSCIRQQARIVSYCTALGVEVQRAVVVARMRNPHRCHFKPFLF